MADMEREFNWDDTITKDAAEFVLLPEGDYDFEVESSVIAVVMVARSAAMNVPKTVIVDVAG